MLKRKSIFFSALLITLLLSACATNEVTPLVTPVISIPASAMVSAVPTPAPQVAAFADPILEQAVRHALVKPTGDLTQQDALRITALRLYGSASPVRLDGVEQLANLEVLDMVSAGVTDIRPLARLPKLKQLSLKDNSIEDISPLKGLTNLETLDLSRNVIGDIAPLSALTNLKELRLDQNKVSDLSPLSDLTDLETLSLADNAVQGISALGALTALRSLDLSGNFEIADYSPLEKLNRIETISVDFLNRKDIGILERNPSLQSATSFGYIARAAAPGEKVDLSKYYETMDRADKVLSEIIKPGMSAYEKECAVFDWVQAHVTYVLVTDVPRTFYSAYGGLIRGSDECQGFAYTLNLLMNKAGVYCISIHNVGHYWNLVRLDDGYYHLDGSRSVVRGIKYFNMTDEMAWKSDRQWDRRLYPACNGSKYVTKQN